MTMKEILLTPGQVNKMRHALGMDKPYATLNGSSTFKAHRNYYVTGTDMEWEFLVSQNFAIKRQDPFCPKDVVYHLTPQGIDVLSSYTGIKIEVD